jgi:hypothetical protein
MPNFNGSVIIPNTGVKGGIKSILRFTGINLAINLKAGIVLNYRNLGGSRAIEGTSNTVIIQPTPTRTVGQLFP